MFRWTVVMCAVAIDAAAQAQGVPQLKLAAPVELPGVEFTRVGEIRELPDRRLVVVDGGDRQAYIVDFARRSAVKIGRQGAGPGEYRSPGRLLAISSDSTLLVDAFGGRWLVMVRDSFVGVVGDEAPAMKAGRNPLGVDQRGNVIGTAPGRNLSGMVGKVTLLAESTWVVRVSRATGRVDTIAKFRARPGRMTVQGTSDKPTAVSVRMNPISTGEQAVVFPDGAVAVARLDPYRVDWFIGGKEVKGKPLPFDAVPVTHEEKVGVLDRSQFSDGSKPKPEDFEDWPETFPPFPSNGMLAGPDGMLWIRRQRTLKAPETDYDIVDRTGRLARRVHLPANEVVVGFGQNSIYVIAKDDDDVQHLRRYPLPSAIRPMFKPAF